MEFRQIGYESLMQGPWMFSSHMTCVCMGAEGFYKVSQSWDETDIETIGERTEFAERDGDGMVCQKCRGPADTC
eukprot:1160390-Pelagomonas_calceolata.AAC.11